MSEQTAFHWLAVGYVSPPARAVIEEKGGQLRDLSSEPRVGVMENSSTAWARSSGTMATWGELRKMSPGAE
jgi:hypothetical protein